MSLFQTILNQVKERLSLQEHDLESVAVCISEATTVSVVANQLKITKGILYITVPPTLKLAILSKKDDIVKRCKEKGIILYGIR